MRIRNCAAGVALVTVALLAGCASGGGSAAGPTAASALTRPQAGNGSPLSPSVEAAGSSLGQILTDGMGRTLYGFVPDKNATSTCVGTCAATWPPLVGTSSVAAGSGVAAALVGKTARAGGTTQATFGGWPLYYFAGDVKPGDVNGQGVDGVWFVMGLDGKLIKETA